MRDNDVDLLPDKFGSDFGIALRASFRPTILDRDSATLDPAEVPQSLHECSCPWSPARCVRAQQPDGRQLARLLRACRARPSRRNAEKGDDLAPHHWTTPELKLGHGNG